MAAIGPPWTTARSDAPMSMSPGLRKFALASHLLFAIGWIGAVLAYLALATAAQVSDSPDTVRAAWIGMELTGWYVIVPLAVASLITGLVMAIGTRWGLFRHYWVVFSLVLTSFATAVLVLHMPTVSSQADTAQDADPAQLPSLGSDLEHPLIGLFVLLAVLVLNIYKPRGMTQYGQRKQADQQEPSHEQPLAGQEADAIPNR
jgi:NADH:ubiquinone oxidoreductase subunit 6 (subunit J)